MHTPTSISNAVQAVNTAVSNALAAPQYNIAGLPSVSVNSSAQYNTQFNNQPVVDVLTALAAGRPPPTIPSMASITNMAQLPLASAPLRQALSSTMVQATNAVNAAARQQQAALRPVISTAAYATQAARPPQVGRSTYSPAVQVPRLAGLKLPVGRQLQRPKVSAAGAALLAPLATTATHTSAIANARGGAVASIPTTAYSTGLYARGPTTSAATPLLQLPSATMSGSVPAPLAKISVAPVKHGGMLVSAKASPSKASAGKAGMSKSALASKIKQEAKAQGKGAGSAGKGSSKTPNGKSRADAAATLAMVSDRSKLKAWHQKTLRAVLNKRGIPEMSAKMASHHQSQSQSHSQSGAGAGAGAGLGLHRGAGGLRGGDRKRRRLNVDADGSSSEGETGLELNMEHDSWSCPAHEGDTEAKWNMAWAGGLSASDDDSDGCADEWARPADACSHAEIVRRRRTHLMRLRSLYSSQYLRLKRILGEKHDEYLKARAKTLSQPDDEGAMRTSGGVGKQPSRIPISRRKQFPDATPSNHDDDDKSTSNFHRYQRHSGADEALILQRRRRQATGHTYPFSAPVESATPGMRLQCTWHPAHLPPCYNRALPYSKLCPRHILKDTHQVLYKTCAYSDKTSSCENPIVFCEEPPYCATHLNLADFRRNPRLSRPPPELPGPGLAGLAYNNDSFSSGAPLDLMHFEEFVEDVPMGADMNMDELTSLEGLGLSANLMGDLPEDESKAVAELQSSLQNELLNATDAGAVAPVQ